MKRTIYLVRPHVRSRHARNFIREASSTDAIHLLKHVILQACKEMRLVDRISVTGSMSRKDVAQITFQSELSTFSLNFK